MATTQKRAHSSDTATASCHCSSGAWVCATPYSDCRAGRGCVMCSIFGGSTTAELPLIRQVYPPPFFPHCWGKKKHRGRYMPLWITREPKRPPSGVWRLSYCAMSEEKALFKPHVKGHHQEKAAHSSSGWWNPRRNLVVAVSTAQ